MTDARDLSTIVRVCRDYTAAERRLCCPRCGGRVVLHDSELKCVQMYMSDLPSSLCEWTGERLAELAVKDS